MSAASSAASAEPASTLSGQPASAIPGPTRDPSARTSRAASELRRRRLNAAVGILSVPLFLLVWEGVSRSGIVNEVLFPPPTTVAEALRDWFSSGDLFPDLGASFARVVVGFLLGSVCGVVLGVLTGRIEILSRLLGPIFQILRPIPPIAFVPVVILW